MLVPNFKLCAPVSHDRLFTICSVLKSRLLPHVVFSCGDVMSVKSR